MFGLLDDIASGIGSVIGTVAGIAIAPLALTLGVSVDVIKYAIKSGCETEEEIRDFVNNL